MGLTPNSQTLICRIEPPSAASGAQGSRQGDTAWTVASSSQISAPSPHPTDTDALQYLITGQSTAISRTVTSPLETLRSTGTSPSQTRKPAWQRLTSSSTALRSASSARIASGAGTMRPCKSGRSSKIAQYGPHRPPSSGHTHRHDRPIRNQAWDRRPMSTLESQPRTG